MCLSQLASQIAVIFLLMLLGALARQLGFLSPTTGYNPLKGDT